MIEIFCRLISEPPLRIRKASGKEETSGDYSAYETVKNTAVNGMAVAMKGNGNSVYLAVWQKDGYSYSVSSESGLSRAKMSNIIRNIR